MAKSSYSSIGGGGSVRAAINRTPFTNEGFGQWTIDIDGVGGASILEDNDTAMGKYYEISLWDKEYNTQRRKFNARTLNEAKQTAKNELEKLNNR